MPSRRQVLAAIGVSTSAVAGCVSNSSERTETDTATTTFVPPHVSTGGTVLRQPTADNPPAIEFTLTNQSDRTVTVAGNGIEPFVDIPRLDGSAGSIVLLPPNDDDVKAEVASAPTDGCWRFVGPDGEESTILFRSITRRSQIDPGESFSIEHLLYYDGDGDACFPDGVYTADHVVEFYGDEPTEPSKHELPFEIRLRVVDGEPAALSVDET